MSRAMNKTLLLLAVFLTGSSALFSQKLTSVKGVVTDAQTKEPLPFVNVAFVGTPVGTTTDLDGSYSMDTKWGSDSLQISFVGYETVKVPVKSG
ncbi:MAG: carboxypeptidase-like regulatory domain-containing protein [Saprospiraceae bacterium]|nr:carboxypeptidase-like regulatory domain-containing protein [Saprospiraceae bacterium]